MSVPIFYVYALGDQRDGEVYYIGCTKNPCQRWAAYKHASSGAQLVNIRHRELKRLKLPPVMVILATADDARHAGAIEQMYVDYFRAHGAQLENGSVPIFYRPDSYYVHPAV